MSIAKPWAEQVVREFGGSSSTNLTFSMLNRSNFSNWLMVMEVNLQAASLWDAIEDDTVPGERTSKRWRCCYDPPL